MATRKATGKKGTGAPAKARKATAKKSATKKAATKKPATRKSATRKSAKRAPVTPRKALAVTHRLLEQKQAESRQVPAWQQALSGQVPVEDVGYQSDQARIKSLELHEGQARLKPIGGSISTRGRHNQGKRDSKS